MLGLGPVGEELLPGRAVQGRASRRREQHVAGGRKGEERAVKAAAQVGGGTRAVSEPGAGASLRLWLMSPAMQEGGVLGKPGCWAGKGGLHMAGEPLTLFFRGHLLLKGTRTACHGTWARQVLVGALGARGCPTPPHAVCLFAFACGTGLTSHALRRSDHIILFLFCTD